MEYKLASHIYNEISVPENDSIIRLGPENTRVMNEIKQPKQNNITEENCGSFYWKLTVNIDKAAPPEEVENIY